MGRPLTLTAEVLPVSHGRKLSLLSLRPRGGPRLTRQKDPREAWQCFAGLIGPLSASFRQVNETLYRQGYATVHDLQLLRVDFNSNYEESPLQRRAARQRCVQEEITQLRGVNRTPSPTSSCRSSSRCSRGAMPEADFAARSVFIHSLRSQVTKTYQLEVTRVSKEVDILSAEAEATIARINAQAQREASVTINQARLERGYINKLVD